MYIKWRKEQLRNKARSIVLRAQVARSYRDRVTGEVRSEFIAYLASIRDSHRDLPLAQERFWRDVDRKLSCLSFAPDDEQHIREKLLEKVPRPRGWAEILAPYSRFARQGVR